MTIKPVFRVNMIKIYAINLIFSIAAPVLCANTDLTIPDIPSFLPDSKPMGTVLPKLEFPKKKNTRSMRAGKKYQMRGFRFSGNSVLSNARLAELSHQYLSRPVNISDLHALRDSITHEYIRMGYLTSGAILPEQEVKDGIVQFKIVEGKLQSIQTSTDGNLHAEYFSQHLKNASRPVLNIFKLEERLQLIQEDVRVKAVHARLQPSDERGLAVLNLRVKENTPYDFVGEINNHFSPHIGAEGIKISAQHDKLGGTGKQLKAQFEKTEGFTKASFKYSQPLLGTDNSYEVYLGLSQSEVVDKIFRELKIKDDSQTLRFTFRDSKILNINRRFNWYLAAYYQHGETYLDGRPFDGPFSFDDGKDDGEVDLLGIRFGNDWISRNHSRVLLLGWTTSIGIPVPDDDVDSDEVLSPDDPNGESLVFNGNAQWAQKLNFLNGRLFTRFNFQFSNASLYGMQQFSLAGNAAVRGYRENLIVRDNGALGSMELRIPFFISTGTRMSAAIFADGGTAWQTKRINDGPRVLASTGLGIVGKIAKKTQFKFYLAKALRDVSHLGEENMQDQGIHFSLSSQWR